MHRRMEEDLGAIRDSVLRMSVEHDGVAFVFRHYAFYGVSRVPNME